MTITTSPPSVRSLGLSAAEGVALRELADSVMADAGSELDALPFIDAVRRYAQQAPLRMREALGEFRRYSADAGLLLLRGLPVDRDLGDTPTVAGSVQRTASVASISLAVTALLLGEPVAFTAEKSGALVHDVVPVASLARSQSNGGSVPLAFHVENAFHTHRPDYVILLCLRSDPLSDAALRVAGLRQVMPLLTTEELAVLRAPLFETSAPPSFGAADRGGPQHPVIAGCADDPDIRVDFNATRGMVPESRQALERLRQLMDEVALDIRLAPGEMAVVDNRLAVHGRSRFEPGYHGKDRWLRRIYVSADLRRSRTVRPHNGHVIAS